VRECLSPIASSKRVSASSPRRPSVYSSNLSPSSTWFILYQHIGQPYSSPGYPFLRQLVRPQIVSSASDLFGCTADEG
jgi:hypothetical protein